MAKRFKNMAGGDGAALVAWSDARETGAAGRRGYLGGQTPSCPTLVGGCAHRLAAAIEAVALSNRRQLKI